MKSRNEDTNNAIKWKVTTTVLDMRKSTLRLKCPLVVGLRQDIIEDTIENITHQHQN